MAKKQKQSPKAPSKKDGDKPVMVAARVHPRLQYGLRLLARVQGGTIAEAMEWALNLAMRRTGIGSGADASTLDVLVKKAWDAESAPRRIYVVSSMAPELLDFDERGAWNLVKRTKELWKEVAFDVVEDSDEGPELIEVEPGDGIPGSDARVPIFDVIEKHWDTIKETGVLLAKNGEIDKSYTLKQILSGQALSDAGIDTDY